MDVNEALLLFDKLCDDEFERDLPVSEHSFQNVAHEVTVEPLIKLAEDDFVDRDNTFVQNFDSADTSCSEFTTILCDVGDDMSVRTDHSYSVGNLSSLSNDITFESDSNSVDAPMGNSVDAQPDLATTCNSKISPHDGAISNVNLCESQTGVMFVESASICAVKEHVDKPDPQAVRANDIPVVPFNCPTTDNTPGTSGMIVSPSEAKPRSRKRTRDPENWQRNIRKRLCQSGESYVTSKGKQKCSRSIKIKKDCCTKCKFKCALLIPSETRQLIHSEFWRLSDSEKLGFYGSTTVRTAKERTRTSNKATPRKQYSISYFLNVDGSMIRVCKVFYLTTLDISQRRVSYFYNKTTTSFFDCRGKHVKVKTTDAKINAVKKHIQSFPRIPAHYCRASSKREYLEPGLTLAKMYELYKNWCSEQECEPISLYMYRTIFGNSFNIGFHVPKKDRCDHCEEYKVLKSRHSQVPDEMFAKYLAHVNDKENSRAERMKDRKSENVVVCFDMENVITLPKTNISGAFYKRKLTVFNLTGHCSKNKINYNAIWAEHIAGRNGNAIASALLVILDKICNDLPETTRIILWSDSCVPQNRNSHMATAIKLFIRSHPQIVRVEQKFSSPGHSCVQEVDNAHSHNERAFSVSEIFSPVSLIRVLTSVRPNNTTIIQMKPGDFRNFQKASSCVRFARVPFASVKHLVYENDKPGVCSYRTCFTETQFHEVSLIAKTRNGKVAPTFTLGAPVITRKATLSSEKVSDLKNLMKFMPEVDKNYYETIFRKKK